MCFCLQCVQLAIFIKKKKKEEMRAVRADNFVYFF